MKNLNITITLTSTAELEGLLDGLDMFCDCNDENSQAGDLKGKEQAALLRKVAVCRNLAASIRGER